MSVYFIRCGQYIKIGVSANPWERIAKFQTANPEPLEMLAVIPGDLAFEVELHKVFSEYHHNGEWFCDNEQLRQFIQVMRDIFPAMQDRPEIDEEPIEFDQQRGAFSFMTQEDREDLLAARERRQRTLYLVSEKEAQQILALYKEGNSLRSIEAAVYGFSGGTAFHRVKAVVGDALQQASKNEA